jgi:UDP-N-acetylmuramoylalanine--D-glutamate ligase
VPLALPVFTRARERGREIIGEVELAARFSEVELLALTGTNGKTTTVTLLGEIFQAAGKDVFVGCNLGRPAVEMVDSGCETAILELSSFQLESIVSFRPKIAVILNLTSDHQDRYVNDDAYLAAKARICQMQGRDDFLILNYDDLKLRVFGENMRCRYRAGEDLPQVIFFSVSEVFAESGASWVADRIVIKTKSVNGSPLECEFEAPQIKLPGQHNRANYLAALLAALIFEIDEQIVLPALSSFAGIPHRLEFVGTRNGVDFYNDSKATNIDAVIKAVGSFEKPLLLLLGGYDKGADFTLLEEHLQSNNVRHLLAFGQAAPEIARQLPQYAYNFQAADLEGVLELAETLAEPGEVVILAPGCASFDEFVNYEKRGDRFRELVQRGGE